MLEKKKDKGTNIELPEAAKKLLYTMICNVVEDSLRTKGWQERSEGVNN